jgi:hypothetical protein
MALTLLQVNGIYWTQRGLSIIPATLFILSFISRNFVGILYEMVRFRLPALALNLKNG